MNDLFLVLSTGTGQDGPELRLFKTDYQAHGYAAGLYESFDHDSSEYNCQIFRINAGDNSMELIWSWL